MKKKQIGDVKDITIEIIQNETVKKKPKNNYEKTEPQGFARQSNCLTDTQLKFQKAEKKGEKDIV